MSVPRNPSPCRACGGRRFVDSGEAHWEIHQRLDTGNFINQSLYGQILACAGCGLLEMFVDDARVLSGFPGSREIEATLVADPFRGTPSAGSSDWQVVLIHAGPTPIGLIAALRQELPLDLATARSALAKLPWVLTKTSNRRVADSLAEKLQALGAVVRVESA